MGQNAVDRTTDIVDTLCNYFARMAGDKHLSDADKAETLNGVVANLSRALTADSTNTDVLRIASSAFHSCMQTIPTLPESIKDKVSKTVLGFAADMGIHLP